MTLAPATETTHPDPRVARRDLMTAGVAGAAATILKPSRARAKLAAPMPQRPELFAFPAPGADAVVVAVTFPAPLEVQRGAVLPLVRLHAGPDLTWTVRDNGALVSMASMGGALIYAGRLPHPAGPHQLVSVTVPTRILPPGRLAVWAELLGEGTERIRVGSPIVAELLERDPSFRRVFNKAHPAHDGKLFTAALAERLAARGPAEGALSPREHAERLAALLLPDVLTYDPQQPVGFTFAGQNGRRPSDSVSEIVDSVLAGAVARPRTPRPAFSAVEAFPYFQTAA